ncbi:hypothetical protein O3M35_004213 [Rhynocoris fuscipes]|uniref:Nucleosome assembly protein 1-like 4 n=1 Tax=Rhynocoris fuscipes TaxID=488301 RepID=A0AAW1CGR2_9HEMI
MSHNLDMSQLSIVDSDKNKKNTEGNKTVSAELTGDKNCRFNDNESSLTFLMLPPKMKRRLKALKKLQLQYTHLEAKFYEEVHKLECTFNKLYSELFDKRAEIISGKYEPSEDECTFLSNQTDDLPTELLEKMNLGSANRMDPESPGIPQFWLTIFKNVAMLNDMVQPHDEPILAHLQDIKVTFLEKDPMGFILEFYFSENAYFTNNVLSKQYDMKCLPDEQDPFSFEGPEIYKCKGCTINWKTGKDVTVKVVKKRQKHKSRGNTRTVTKLVKNDSFFNFFSPPVVKDGCEADLDEETQALLTSDFEIGHYIRERIVPNAVLYYTGEALDDEEEYDDDEGDEEEDEDSDEMSSESDNDSEIAYYHNKQDANNATNQSGAPAPECKQQ